jgi:uncharacterized protein DUF4038/uncharacterized protein DUF5060
VTGAVRAIFIFLLCAIAIPAVAVSAPAAHGAIFETSFTSAKRYADPFNEVDVDAIFSRGRESWRVPAFWRGGSEWGVRFSPPTPGEFSLRLESSDRNNPDLNGRRARVAIGAYAGSNDLFRRGAVRVSANKRYLEYGDGTPFYWLGDTWWTGMSSRLSWEGYQRLTADRKAKGFTVVQIVAGLVPPEEIAPTDPGFHNEGGAVWDAQFRQINPAFFDYADRRVQHLVDAGIAPAIVGGWNEIVMQMGVERMKKHWRYLIARYSAYPVFWIVGGEVYDPPEDIARVLPGAAFPKIVRGWTDIARYIRATDPMHRLLTVHEVPPPWDFPLQDASVTDFELLQSSHFSWLSIGTEISQVNLRYARTGVTKPIIVGEVGYEALGGQHLEDFQRAAFWLGMLNGAAGFTYGANGTWESYSAESPLHRKRWSFMTWEEGMNLPGSAQVAFGAKLLRQYPWQSFAPHPEWVRPRGTTLLEPRERVNAFDVDLLRLVLAPDTTSSSFAESEAPAGEWAKRKGNFRLPYAAGVPGEVRMIYMPYFALLPPRVPTILGLEPAIRYRAYYWEPSMGIRFDLGIVERSSPGASISADDAQIGNVVATVKARADADAGMLLRYRDSDNYLAAMYSSKDKSVFLLDRQQGVDGARLAVVSAPSLGPDIQLSAEVREGFAVVSVADGKQTFTSEIVAVKTTGAGRAKLFTDATNTQRYSGFELRESLAPPSQKPIDRQLTDMSGRHRGELEGPGSPEAPGWSDYGSRRQVMLDAYRPESLPGSGDWVLVLERSK